MKPSISFHTLVKLVDAEDIANDKIRTHDLTLEVNNITKQLQTQSLHSQQSDQVMSTQPRIDTTLVLDIDHAHIQETTILPSIQIHIDHLLDQEILDFLDPVHSQILETKSI